MIRWLITLLFFLCAAQMAAAQSLWHYYPRAELPMPISNNAVTAALINGNPFVYSFAGIDSTKIHSGITNAAFRYDVLNNRWDTLPSLPDSVTRIPAAASTGKDKIYIIGGYHVFPNGNELSVDRVHIFDPGSNQYLPDGASVPTPIDDHVQAVWRDSLIYVITGWSNSSNVNKVQTYNPATDSWMAGTPVPNNGAYKVFGASGVIIGDTIYYPGGARFAFNFPLDSALRIGIIHPQQPDSITWSMTTPPWSLGYRMGAAVYQGQVLWLGGSAVSYNFNGSAYNGSGGVPPLGRIVRYDPLTGQAVVDSQAIVPVMDLRGVAAIAPGQFIIAGGMGSGQQVSAKTWLISDQPLSARAPVRSQVAPVTIQSFPLEGVITIHLHDPAWQPYQLELFDLAGRLIHREVVKRRTHRLLLLNSRAGLYLVRVQHAGQQVTAKVMIPGR